MCADLCCWLCWKPEDRSRSPMPRNKKKSGSKHVECKWHLHVSPPASKRQSSGNTTWLCCWRTCRRGRPHDGPGRNAKGDAWHLKGHAAHPWNETAAPLSHWLIATPTSAREKDRRDRVRQPCGWRCNADGQRELPLFNSKLVLTDSLPAENGSLSPSSR